ncbi:MAG: hypothetical protein JWM51_802 [Microbacteriaceae bacterium]|jgi:copper chaperone|nr:hypothetical protein [Microbacteriaceae bacterium]
MCTDQTTGNDLGLTDKNHACACGTDSHADNTARGHEESHDNGSATAEPSARGEAEVIREHYLVGGMTCAHCVASVTEEVSAIDGVDSVSVDLNTAGASRIMVVSAKPVPASDVEAAVIEAGYTLVSA